MNKFFKQNYIYCIAIFAMIIIAIIANLQTTIFFSPTGVHMWRQCDVASYAYQYYFKNQSFWQPATMTLLGDEGRTASEFPIVYYLCGKLYHLFGFHDYYIRIAHLGFFLLGFVSYLSIVKKYMNHVVMIFPLFIWLTLPYIFYYTFNFLPNIPAVSCIMVSIWALLKHSETKKQIYFFIHLFFLILGSILKISEALVWIAFILSYFQVQLDLKNRNKIWSEIKNNKLILLLYFVSICIILFWYQFAKYYNISNHTSQNLLGIIPIWEMSWNNIQQTISRIFNKQWGWFHAVITWHYGILFVGLISYFLYYFKHIHQFLKYFTIWIFVGVVMYSLLWFQAFYDHDYYMIPLSYILFALTIAVLHHLVFINTMKSKWIITLGCFILGFASYHNGKVQQSRYFTNNEEDRYFPNKAMYELQPFLEKNKVSPSDYIVVSNDFSPNISLYFLRRQGWTTGFFKHATSLQTFKDKGAKYFVALDTSALALPMFKQSNMQFVDSINGISLYAIK